MSADHDAGADDPELPEARTARAVVLAGLGLLVGGLLTVAVLTAVRSPAPPDFFPITASPLATPTDAGPAEPDRSPDPAPDDGGAPTPSATPDVRTAETFAAAFEPPAGTKGDSVTSDVDDDGIPDVVIASLVSRTVRVDFATWSGNGYAVVFTGHGGPADTLEGVSVADFTRDGTSEVVTVQAVGSLGESLSIWGPSAAGLSPQRAAGGCADGSHTFGVAGVQITHGRILASCDGSPLPPEQWPVDEYGWDGTAWTYRSTTDMAAADLREGPSVAGS